MKNRKQNSNDMLTVTKISLRTGPFFFEDSKVGVKKVITTFKNGDSL